MLNSSFTELRARYDQFVGASLNRRVLGATALIAVVTTVVKLAVVGKELVVAWQFGTSDALDAFLIALLVPLFAVGVVSGSFASALIPTYISVREREGQGAADRLCAAVMTWSLVLLTFATILIVLAAPAYLPWLASGFSAEKLALTRRLLTVLAPTILLSGVAAIWAAVVNAGERFLLTSLVPILTPVLTVACVLSAGGKWGAYALAAGVVLGQLVELAALGAGLRTFGLPLGLSRPAGEPSPHTRQVVGQYVPMMAGSLLMGSTAVVNQAMAAMLPSGSVATLSYGNRLISLPVALATTALGTALLPVLSSMAARGDLDGLRHTLRRFLQIVFALAVPLTAAIVVWSEPLVRLLFQRGAFSAHDTAAVAGVQALFAFQIPFYTAGMVAVRMISALRANHILMWGAALNLAVNVTLNLVFIPWLGVAGIALATSVVYVVSFVFVLVSIQLILKRLR